MKKFHFVYDKTKKSENLKKILSKKYKNTNPKKADFIIVAGGDGFMLNILKKYYNLKNPFMELIVGLMVF